MDEALIEHLREKCGAPPRKLSRKEFDCLCHPLPRGWTGTEESAYLIRGQEAIWTEGFVTLGWVLKAYYEIYGPGDSDHLGMVLFSDSADLKLACVEVPKVLETLSSLRGTTDPDWTQEERQFMAAYDDDYHRCGGLEVPKRFSPALRCFIADFYFHRPWMPEQCLRPGSLPVIAVTTPAPRANQIPASLWTQDFRKAWSDQILKSVRAYAQTARRLRRAAGLRTRYLAAPTIQPESAVSLKDLEGTWVYEEEIEKVDRPDCCHTVYMRNSWRFHRDGSFNFVNEFLPLINGEPDTSVEACREHLEGRYELQGGIIRLDYAASPQHPKHLMVLSRTRLAFNQTERVRGPYMGPLGSAEEFGHFATHDTASSSWLRFEAEKAASAEWVEIQLDPMEVPPGYRCAVEEALAAALADIPGASIESGCGFCNVMLELPREHKVAVLERVRQTLIDYEAPNGTRVVGPDGEPLIEITAAGAAPPPLPATHAARRSKLAVAAFVSGVLALGVAVWAWLAPLFLVAGLLGFVALKRLRKRAGVVTGRGWAVWAIILALVSGGVLLSKTVASFVSAFAALNAASAELEKEPGYAAAQVAEKATGPAGEGASGNSDAAHVVAEDIAVALVALQKKMLPGYRSDVMLERAPAVYVHASKSKVAVIVSFRFGAVRWRGRSEDDFNEAAWAWVHRMVSRAQIVPDQTPLALGIHSYGNYSAMFFGRTDLNAPLGEPLPVPPHEREIRQGFVLNNSRRLYGYFAPDALREVE
jgi:hypothetical protein